MLFKGQLYNCVHFAGHLEILEILEPKNEIKIKTIANDGLESTSKENLQKFIWAIDRGDYVNQRILCRQEQWFLDGVKKVLNDCFGLQNALGSCDELRMQTAVNILAGRTGYQKKFIYSIIHTIKEL